MKRLGLICLLAFWAFRPIFGQSNGIFADFSTSLGSFTVWLDSANAPRAVASFVGLATGERSWVDPQGNVWKRPFYDGSIFHRVVKTVVTNEGVVQTNGIAIQGGGVVSFSVNTNTGVVTTNFIHEVYNMLESVTNGLVHSNGVIAMANSGPNTDGSQFFITATNVPGWNGSYTVFGHVTTGMMVVTSIAAVAVQGTLERPVQDVVLSNVVIRREGAGATNFNIASQGVPVVESGPMRTFASGTNQMLVFDFATQTEMVFRRTTDLKVWETDNWGFYTNPAAVITASVSRASLSNTYYFHLSRIRYPTPITSPTGVRGRFFTFWWNTAPATKYEVIFSSHPATQGQYRVTLGSNAPVLGTVFVGDLWTRDPYSARLIFMDNSAKEYTYSLGFNPGQTTNRFTGKVVDLFGGTTRSIAGVFTVR